MNGPLLVAVFLCVHRTFASSLRRLQRPTQRACSGGGRRRRRTSRTAAAAQRRHGPERSAAPAKGKRTSKSRPAATAYPAPQQKLAGQGRRARLGVTSDGQGVVSEIDPNSQTASANELHVGDRICTIGSTSYHLEAPFSRSSSCQSTRASRATRSAWRRAPAVAAAALVQRRLLRLHGRRVRCRLAWCSACRFLQRRLNSPLAGDPPTAAPSRGPPCPHCGRPRGRAMMRMPRSALRVNPLGASARAPGALPAMPALAPAPAAMPTPSMDLLAWTRRRLPRGQQWIRRQQRGGGRRWRRLRRWRLRVAASAAGASVMEASAVVVAAVGGSAMEASAGVVAVVSTQPWRRRRAAAAAVASTPALAAAAEVAALVRRSPPRCRRLRLRLPRPRRALRMLSGRK